MSQHTQLCSSFHSLSFHSLSFHNTLRLSLCCSLCNSLRNSLRSFRHSLLAPQLASLVASLAAGCRIRMVSESESIQKKVAFHPTTTVSTMCETLSAKFHIPSEDGYGLFFPPSQYRTSKWLMSNKTAEFYDLKDDETLEYRRRHRPLRIKLPDGVFKTVVIDENMVVAELCKVIGAKVGIDNYAEYSLKVEGSSAVEWLVRNKTLIDQGIDATAQLEYKQRLFFTDAEVNLNNPRELHLLFEQCRESILTGNAVCSFEEAIELAAYQLHLTHGDYDPASPPEFALDEYMPPEYRRLKKAKRLIIDAYAACVGTNMEQAKYQYVSVCRGLKTYGVTFFTATEAITSKKSRPVLIGISKERIMKFDGKSKKILAEWPLTYIRRCASTRSTFTVDFGEHEDAYHTYQTGEGDSIKAVIEGYQHLSKSREEQAAADAALMAARGPSLEEQEAEAEAAAKAKADKRASQMGARKGDGGEGSSSSGNSSGPGSNVLARGAAGEILVNADTVSAKLNQIGLSDLNVELSYVAKVINNALEDISAPAAAAPVSDESWRREALVTVRGSVADHTVRLCIGVAKVIAAVVVLKADDFEPELLYSAVKLMGEAVTELVTACRAVGALAEGMVGPMVVDMCRMVITASLRVVAAATRASVTLADHKVDSEMKDELLAAAQTTGNGAWELLRRASANDVQDGHFKMMDKALATAARAITIVIACAKMSSEALPQGSAVKDSLVDAAMDVYTCITHMTATARVTMPSILSDVSLEELEACVADVLDSISSVVSVVESAQVPGDHKANVLAAQASAQEALANLITIARDPGDRASFEDLLRNAHEHIANTVSLLIKSSSDPGALLQHVKMIGGTATDLVNSLNRAAEMSPDMDLRARLLAAADNVSKHAQALVLAAKNALANPNDINAQMTVSQLGMRIDNLIQQMLLDFSVALADPQLGDEFDDFSALISASKNLGTKVRKFSTTARVSASEGSGGRGGGGGGLLAAAAAARAMGPDQ